MSDEPIVWRLVVDLAGEDFRDRVILDSEDPMELLPEVVAVGDVAFERYPGAEHGEYVEFRQDYVAVRRLTAMRSSPQSAAVDEEDQSRAIERRKMDEA